MNTRTRLSWTAIIALIGAVAGCANSTQLGRVWRDPAYSTNSLSRLMVIGVGKTATTRRSFEDRFAAALQQQGVEGLISYSLVGDGALDSVLTNQEMHRTGCDGVLVTRLVDQKIVRSYSVPNGGYWRPPAAYYDGWNRYYSLGLAYTTAPGYTIENQVVTFETVLYRVADGKLVWSALSHEWLAPSDTPGEEVDTFVREVVKALVDSRVIGKAAMVP